MDNLTHTLFAFTLARTPLERAGRGTTAALILASNAPDVDALSAIGGAGNYLTWHRGPTHGPLGIVGLGLLTAGLVAMGLRTTKRWPDDPADAPFRLLAPIAMMGVLFHVLMDLPTSYGTRLLSPFDWHWFALDWLPIVDVYLLFALIAGILFGGASAAGRRRNAAIVLALMAANYGVRGAAHRQALGAAPRLFGPTLPQPCGPAPSSRAILDYWPRELASISSEPGKRCLVEVVAIPTFFSPFSWRVIARLSNGYDVHDVDLLDARVRGPANPSDVMWRTSYRIPNVWTPPVWSATSAKLAQIFLGFSRLPAARSSIDPAGNTTIRWNDMRFLDARSAITPARGGPFALVVRVAPDGRVLDQQLGQ